MKRLRLTLLALTLCVASLAGPASALAQEGPFVSFFPACDGSHDGALFIQPETNWAYRCTNLGAPDLWAWVPLGDIDWLDDWQLWGIQGSSGGCVNTGTGVGWGDFQAVGMSRVASHWAGLDADGNGCDYHRTQPPGELRDQIIVKRWDGSSWTPCRSYGYTYNTGNAWSMVTGWNMGLFADCGGGYYRSDGYGGTYDSGAWHTNYTISPYRWFN
jgi:hypothetical protein